VPDFEIRRHYRDDGRGCFFHYCCFRNEVILMFKVIVLLLSCTAVNAAGFGAAYFRIPFNIDRVVDGDTMDVIVQPWPKLHIDDRVRLYGIDTPEKRTRNLCEKALGLQATKFAVDWLNSHENLTMDLIGRGKYGRMLVTIWSGNSSLNQELIDANLANPYFGKGKRKPWCIDGKRI